MAMELLSKLPYDHPYRWDGTKFGSGKLWRPSDLGADLDLWLDAEDTNSITLNGSNVSQWNDKSGNARHASQTTASAQPTNPIDLNNRRVIQFDGFDDFLSVPEFTTSATVFIVGNKGQATYPQLSGADPGSFIPTWNVNGDRLEYRSASTQTIVSAIASGSTAEYAFGCVQLDTVNDEVKLNIFGGAVTTFSQTVGSSDLTINTIGRDFAGSQQVTDGAIAEIITLNNLPSTEDRQKVEGYLAWKWELVGNLPADHPYKTQPPFVIDPEAQKYLRAVESVDGEPLEEGVRLAVNDFVVGCKSDGIWDAIKASAILAGARTLGGALVPLTGAAPTNFNFVSGDYNRATGLKGDGSTKYLNTNRNNNADPQDSRHLSVYQTEPMTTDVSILIGSSSVTGRTTLIRVTNTAARIAASSGAHPTVAGAGVSGFLGGARFSSTNVAIRNGGVTTTGSVTSEVPASDDLGVFAASNGGAASNARLSFYSIGEGLDLAKLDARVSTLITAIGAAIP